MKPILVGYTNPTDVSDVGEPSRRQGIYLTADDLGTHIHGVGATRSGKSKWIEWFCRQLVRQGAGFTLIDPQGALAEALVQYFAYYLPRQPVIYFDPSRTDYLIPFNPFKSGIDETSVRVSKQVEATLRVWGAENADETPRLGRILRCVYHLYTTGHISMNEVHALLMWGNADLRAHAVRLLGHNPTVQDEWRELAGYTRASDYLAQVESTRNRLFPFVEPPQIRRIMSLEDPSLDFRTVFEQGAIVIANLRESEAFSEDNGRLMGTLMINELWSAARKYGNAAVNPYFLLIDEVQKFLTPDLKEILDRGAGKGLHLGVFHQHLTQLREQDMWTYDSIMGNAKTKLVFGGLTKPNALIMVDEMFVNQIKYDEIKILIEQTKFWPEYRRDTVYAHTRGGSRGSTTGSGEVVGSGAVSGMSWNPYLEEWLPSASDSQMTASSNFTSAMESESWSDGEADIPIFYPVPFREISSMTPYTLEEQKNRLADSLMAQYQRHYFIKRPGHDTIPAATPFVKTFRIFPENEAAYILEELIKPYALPVTNIDGQLAERLQRLEIEAKGQAQSALPLGQDLNLEDTTPVGPKNFRRKRRRSED